MAHTAGISEARKTDSPRSIRVAHLFGGREGGGIGTAISRIVASTDPEQVHISFLLLKKNRVLLGKLPVDRALVLRKMFSGDPFVIIRVMLYCRRHRIDILHTHSIVGNFYGRLAGLLLPCTVVVTTVHAKTIDELQGAVSGKLRATILHHADLWMHRLSRRLIAVSKSLKDDLVQRGIPAEKVEVIAHGIEVKEVGASPSAQDLQQEREKWNIPHDANIVGIVGRLTRVKNHESFLRAAQSVLKSFPNTVFVIVGDGALRDDLEHLAEQLGIQEHMRITGWVDNAYPILHILDVLVMCSFSEGFGLAILETMACGRAVVATSVSEMPQIIDHRKTGMLVPPDDTAALANMVCTLLDDSELRKTLGDQARQTVIKRFGLATKVATTINTYRSLVSR